MRYSRMREGVQEEKKSSRIGGVVLVLMAVGVVVYLIGAAKVGTFLSDKVIRPLVGVFSEKDDPDPEASEKPEETELISGEVTFPGIETYLLQIGVFTERENAERSAETIAGMGGAGYVLEDGSDLRVIISGYEAKEDAENVKERLLSEQNMESKLYEIRGEEAAYTLETEQSVLDVFGEISRECGAYHKTLMDLSISLDKGEITRQDALGKIEEIRGEIAEKREQLGSWAESAQDELIHRTKDYYTALEEEFSGFEGELTDIQLTARVKHAYSACAVLYGDFLQNGGE